MSWRGLGHLLFYLSLCALVVVVPWPGDRLPDWLRWLLTLFRLH